MIRRSFAAVLSALAAATCGCNLFPGAPSVDPPKLELVKRTLDVTVVAPPGLPPPATIKTGLGSVSVVNGVGAQTPIFEGGPQFAVATDAAGNIQLMGFVGTGAAEINSHTTAEVLLFFSLNAPMLPGDAQEYVLSELKKHAAVQALADAIGSALAADGLALAKRVPAIQTAINFARAQIMGTPSKLKSPASASRVLINPGDAQSGITIRQLGLNSITIRNDFRRRAYYFVEVESYVPEGGGDPVPSHLDVAEHGISPTTGVTSAFGLIRDVFGGNEAFAGVDSDPIELPIIPNKAESTTYKITVVGPGAFTGDYNSMTDAQKDKQLAVFCEAFVVDFFVPALVDLYLPIKGKQIDRYYDLAHANDLWAGLISAVGNAAPQAYRKAEEEGLAAGLYDLKDSLLSDGSARVLVLEAFFQVMDRIGWIGAGNVGMDFFTHHAEAAIAPLDLFDSIFIGFDSIVQVAQFAQSSRANVWKIVSDRTRVKLDPPQADLDQYHSQVFRAEIPDATGTDATIVYHWKCTGNHGGIRDNQHNGAEFDSTEKSVTYFPRVPASYGEDTITVEAFEVRNQNRVSLGTDQATVKVRALIPKLTPERISLNKNESKSFDVTVDSVLANGGTLSYRWFCSNKFGQITHPQPQLETATSTATYEATGTPPGEDTLAVEVFSTKDGVKTSLGIARSQIKIEQRKTIYLGSFNVEVQFAQPGFTGTPGYSFVTAYAKVPKMEGATSYSCRIYNFYDPAYYGHGTVFGDSIVRGREDRGNEYWIGLTGGQARDENVAESVAATASRFVGIIVEVTVTY